MFRENFFDMPKVLSVKIFTMLEKEESGAILVSDLQRFMVAAQSEPGADPEEENSHFEDMRQNLEAFVLWKDVFRRCAPTGKLNIHGAKAILQRLRECKEDEIRDMDTDVSYIVGLTKKQFEKLMHRCPPGAWSALSNFSKIEMILRAMEKYSGPNRKLNFANFLRALSDAGVALSKHDLQDIMRSLGEDPSQLLLPERL